MSEMRARAERFGAWVRLDDATLLALDRDAARDLGIDGRELWTGPAPTDAAGVPSAPLELHVAITARCPTSCEGCYLDARADGAHVDLDVLDRTLSAAARAGVFTVAFGGGEPLGHPDLGRIAERARAHGLVPVVTTSGLGLGPRELEQLRAFAQVNVSYDGQGTTYRAVRGYDASLAAERAIVQLASAGVAVGVNVVLTRASFGDGGEELAGTCVRAASLGAREVQLLRYKPAGRAVSLDYLDKRLRPEQIDALPAVLRRLVALGTGTPAFSVRVDCALVPLLSPAFEDDASLLALAVMGCEAGSALGAVTSRGWLSPCSFLPETTDGPGSLAAVFGDGSASGPLAALRSFAEALPEPCGSCSIRRVCRGGCRVVASHLGGSALSPDPECPRVSALATPA